MVWQGNRAYTMPVQKNAACWEPFRRDIAQGYTFDSLKNNLFELLEKVVLIFPRKLFHFLHMPLTITSWAE